jgi:O-antigen/teichoic acid export membrane protein
MQNIGQKMALGAGWMVLFKLCERGLGLVSVTILARLLVPEDFGLVAMAMSVIAMLDLLRAFSFDIVLIQQQAVERCHYDTVWTFNVLFSVAITALLVVLAIPTAQFYGEPRLKTIMYFLALATLVTGFENIGIVAFRKELQFHKEFVFQVGKKLIGFCVTIPLAIMLQSYWALLSGTIAAYLGGVVLSYALQSYRPKFCLSAASELFRFSKWLFMNNTLFFLRQRSVDFIVGKLAGAHALGVFSLSYEISNLPTSELVMPINRAVFPGYAKLSARLEELRESYLQVVSSIALFVMPTGVGLVLTADLVVPILLGAKWMEVVPAMQILALGGVLTALQTNNGNVYLALGRPRLLTALATLSVCIMFPLVIWLTQSYGSIGTVGGLFLSVVAMLPINFFVLSRVLKLKFRQLAGVLWRPAIATVVMWLAGKALKNSLLQSHELAGQALCLVLLVLSGAVVYVVVSLSVWRLVGRPAGAERFVVDHVLRFVNPWMTQVQDDCDLPQTLPNVCVRARGETTDLTRSQS